MLTFPQIHGPHSRFSQFIRPKEIQSLRNQLPIELNTCSTYELITAYTWKSRTIALGLDKSNEIVRASAVINIRGKDYSMNLPKGYYGNAFVFVAVCSKARTLCENSLGYAVRLVKECKDKMSEEYVRSTMDLMVLRGRPTVMSEEGHFILCDNSMWGRIDVTFGWGRPIYGGIGKAISNMSAYLHIRNGDGEIGKLVALWFPRFATKRFEYEYQRLNMIAYGKL